MALTIRSDNGMYTAVISFENGHNLTDATFSLQDKEGIVLYTKDNLASQTFFVSNSGTVFSVDDNTLYHYNKEGDERILKTLEHANGFSFSPDNLLFFASDKEGIFVYSATGSLIHTLDPGRLFDCAENGRQIAVVSNDTLSLYHDGILQQVILLPTPYIHALKFYDDGSSIEIESLSGTLFFDTGLIRKGDQ